jgi:hypothetical protein
MRKFAGLSAVNTYADLLNCGGTREVDGPPQTARTEKLDMGGGARSGEILNRADFADGVRQARTGFRRAVLSVGLAHE